jgi:type VI secretion system protein ImpB
MEGVWAEGGEVRETHDEPEPLSMGEGNTSGIDKPFPITVSQESSMAESIHQKLTRIRKPHVHITYEVETNGAMVVRSLPFVVGVMGDFSGDPTEKLKDLKDRKFVNIDRDNFNEVMARQTPGLEFKAPNTLADDGTEFAVKLKFSSMEDFEPARVVEQVEPLRKLLEVRNRLRDLLSASDRGKGLEETLEAILQNTDQLRSIASELGIGEGKKE